MTIIREERGYNAAKFISPQVQLPRELRIVTNKVNSHEEQGNSECDAAKVISHQEQDNSGKVTRQKSILIKNKVP